MPDTTALLPALDAALQARRDLITRLAAEQTDAYRLFHGTVEGKLMYSFDRATETEPLRPFVWATLQRA